MRPLAGLDVVEFAAYVAAPSGGMLLAQLGARVTRVDPVRGGLDAARWPLAANGGSLYWAGLNKGKRSVALDLRDPRGRELALRLATRPGAERGIVVTNLRDPRWLDYAHLRDLREDVILVEVVGHADGRPAFDYTVNTAVGVPQITGPVGGAEPVNHALPAWDLLAGVYVALAVVSAERRRRETGEGGHVVVPLADAATAAVANLGWLSEARGGVRREPDGNYIYGTFGTDFRTTDGRVMVAALTPRQWAGLVEVTGVADRVAALAAETGADFSSDTARYRHRAALVAILTPWFAARDTARVCDLLDTARVPYGPYRTLSEVAARAEAGEVDGVRVLEQPGIGPVLAAGPPLLFDGVREEPVPAPELGAHTAESLTELGLSPTEISGLAGLGVLRGHP